MNNIELLIVSFLGAIIFYFVIKYFNRKAIGRPNEPQIKRSLKTLSIIYIVLMSIQIIGVIWELIE